jgi:hypothetical protein
MFHLGLLQEHVVRSKENSFRFSYLTKFSNFFEKRLRLSESVQRAIFDQIPGPVIPKSGMLDRVAPQRTEIGASSRRARVVATSLLLVCAGK